MEWIETQPPAFSGSAPASSRALTARNFPSRWGRPLFVRVVRSFVRVVSFTRVKRNLTEVREWWLIMCKHSVVPWEACRQNTTTRVDAAHTTVWWCVMNKRTNGGVVVCEPRLAGGGEERCLRGASLLLPGLSIHATRIRSTQGLNGVNTCFLLVVTGLKPTS